MIIKTCYIVYRPKFSLNNPHEKNKFHKLFPALCTWPMVWIHTPPPHNTLNKSAFFTFERYVISMASREAFDQVQMELEVEGFRHQPSHITFNLWSVLGMYWGRVMQRLREWSNNDWSSLWPMPWEWSYPLTLPGELGPKVWEKQGHREELNMARKIEISVMMPNDILLYSKLVSNPVVIRKASPRNWWKLMQRPRANP